MTKKYGLLGHPLGHSFSRKFHNERFERLAIDAEYVNFDLPEVGLLREVLLTESALYGLNVTIPYKQQVMSFLDELDPLAERIGAVNTIVIRHEVPEGRESRTPGLWLKGYNTDIIGFRDSILPMLEEAGIVDRSGQAVGQQQALILGTGGASRAVLVALEDMGIRPVLVSRSEGAGRLTYDQLDAEIIASHRVIVNCSPVGMYPHVDESPALPYDQISSEHVCYDLIYNPAETQFLARAKANGARTMSGGAMLEGQALAAYDCWTR